MALVTIDTFKAYLKVTRAPDVPDDDLLQAALDAAELGINDACQREFTVAGSATDRLFVPSCTAVLRIDDCTEITAIDDNGSALAVTDWQAEPVNLRARSGLVLPYEQIRRWGGWYQTGYTGQATITITAKWGWSALPSNAVEACKILAKDILANRDVTFGIAGFTDYGGVRARDNPQVAALVANLRRVESFGIG